MTTGLFSHPDCLEHIPPFGHPESPARLRAVLTALDADAFQNLYREQAKAATREALQAAHTEDHVNMILGSFNAQAHSDELVMIDPDTAMSRGSARAALMAAGAVMLAVDRVAGGKIKNAFCAVRPPGHHAPSDRAMGFCLFNNVAVGAFHARNTRLFERIAVMDFDVHHGNGTEEIFWEDPSLLYLSTH